MHEIKDRHPLFVIADTYETLSKPEQLLEWYKFDTARELLFKFSENSKKDYSNKDKDFTYWNDRIIKDYLSQASKKDKKIIKDGLSAVYLLVYSNMRLIIKCTKSFQSDLVDLDTLLQAGVLGALKAIMKFKPDNKIRLEQPRQLSLGLLGEDEPVDENPRTYKVSSYMKPWINCYIRQELKKAKEIIKTPSNIPQSYSYIPLDTTDSSATNHGVFQDLGLDVVSLLEVAPDLIYILESSDTELALEKGLSLTQVSELKQQAIENIKKYI